MAAGMAGGQQRIAYTGTMGLACQLVSFPGEAALILPFTRNSLCTLLGAHNLSRILLYGLMQQKQRVGQFLLPIEGLGSEKWDDSLLSPQRMRDCLFFNNLLK